MSGTRLRFVIRTEDRGRTYYYFRRRGFPIVRLPGRPGSGPFAAVYEAALQATKPEQIMALRGHMRRQRSPKRRSPTADAIMIWAKREPITRAQAAVVAKSLGVSINEIMRGRQIADDPKSETEPNPKNR
jgi:hypothetical protein